MRAVTIKALEKFWSITQMPMDEDNKTIQFFIATDRFQRDLPYLFKTDISLGFRRYALLNASGGLSKYSLNSLNQYYDSLERPSP
jgi:hypothetical protein